MEILKERLREKLKGKGIIPANQTEFKSGMGTMVNVYTINYLINIQIRSEKECYL